MLKILIDTSVWLDLLKDSEGTQTLEVLDELVGEQRVELILPELVVEEFQRNRSRVVKQISDSYLSALKR
jgi:hypothetical protein